jgi:hypothetical protein
MFKKLTDQQMTYLGIFNGLKSFARQERLTEKLGEQVQKEIENQLIELGVLKRDKRGSLRAFGSYHEVIELIRLNEMTLFEAEMQLAQAKQSLINAETDYNKRSKEKDFCFISRDLGESIAYRRDEVKRLAQLVSKLEKATK